MVEPEKSASRDDTGSLVFVAILLVTMLWIGASAIGDLSSANRSTGWRWFSLVACVTALLLAGVTWKSKALVKTPASEAQVAQWQRGVWVIAPVLFLLWLLVDRTGGYLQIVVVAAISGFLLYLLPYQVLRRKHLEAARSGGGSPRASGSRLAP